MDKKVYICTGTCSAEISEEQYKNGLTKCGAKECTMHALPFEERLKCHVCGKLYKQGEDHKH